MYTIGIKSAGHDTSAAILKDGKLLFAIAEDRFNREKHTSRFPESSIQFCLKEAGLDINEVEEIGIGMCWRRRGINRFLYTFRTEGLGSLSKAINLLSDDFDKAYKAKNYLRKQLGYKNKIIFLDHHDCHAAAVYYASPFESAAIISIDGAGEESCTRIYKADGARIVRLLNVNFPNSLGAFYSLVTHFLGFRIDSDEGKTMALAANGDDSYCEALDQIVKSSDTKVYDVDTKYFGFFKGRKDYFSDEFRDLFGNEREKSSSISKKHKNLASATQHKLEQTMLRLAIVAKDLTNSENLCLCGGVALNSVSNGKIMDEGIFRQFYGYPAAGDDGTAVGAAFILYYRRQASRIVYKENVNPYLGYEPTQNEVLMAVKESGLSWRELKQPWKEAASLIARGNIVAWYQDRNEFGPRALGNRSILADPRTKKSATIINTRVKNRESFMPFAPSVLVEDSAKFFQTKGIESPYMLLAFRVKEGYRNQIPAVLNSDGTARIQTVKKEDNYKFWSLIKEFKKITGIPLVLNTSFNRSGEVIVNTPAEAIESFLGCEINYLFIDKYLIMK